MQNLEELKSSIPDYAKDVKINLSTIFSAENQLLSQKQILGTALACAYSVKDEILINILENEAKSHLSEVEISGAKTAAILMAMNNIYYRFTHISHDKEYSQMPAGLRMRGIADHGIEKVDFELFSLGVSVLNGCGMCIDAHANQLIKHGMNKSQIQLVAKIAAIINSTAQLIKIV